MATNYADVHRFHTHFGLPAPQLPQTLPDDVLRFRLKFMEEELDEFRSGAGVGDIAGMADALIDLVYVAMGTAVMMGLPWQLLWDEVQRKNMQKVKVESAADSKRGHAFDIKKPEGWTPPDIGSLLHQYMQFVNLPETDPRRAAIVHAIARGRSYVIVQDDLLVSGPGPFQENYNLSNEDPKQRLKFFDLMDPADPFKQDIVDVDSSEAERKVLENLPGDDGIKVMTEPGVEFGEGDEVGGE